MSDGRTPRGKLDTKLARLRAERGMTQAQMAEQAHIAPQTYWRLERGLRKNPPIRYLVNCAEVLDCRLEDVCEDAWLAWTESFEALDGNVGRSDRS